MPSLQIQKKTTDYEDKESIGFEVELANKDYTKLIDTISCESLVESWQRELITEPRGLDMTRHKDTDTIEIQDLHNYSLVRDRIKKVLKSVWRYVHADLIVYTLNISKEIEHT